MTSALCSRGDRLNTIEAPARDRARFPGATESKKPGKKGKIFTPSNICWINDL
jgi:hypothetical protein